MEAFLRNCSSCHMQNRNSTHVHYSPWDKTNHPFQRIQIDFFNFGENKFLLMVDSYSKWVKVKLVKSTAAAETIGKLQNILSFVGLPSMIVSDNAYPFSSWEFTNGCNVQGINLMHSPPYHPQSNGLSERAFRDIKSYVLHMNDT